MGDIKGYRQLNGAEIRAINSVKDLATQTGALVSILESGELVTGEGVDARWVAIAKTQLQQGFMALVRAIAQPESF